MWDNRPRPCYGVVHSITASLLALPSDGPYGAHILSDLRPQHRAWTSAVFRLRLWLLGFAHLIMSALQAEVLKGTELKSASIGPIRLRLFKVAARLKTSARRIHIERCTAYAQSAFALGSTATQCLKQSRVIFKPDRQESVPRKGELEAEELCL
jgi:hypothetical protein